jgi:hypothetical protein
MTWVYEMAEAGINAVSTPPLTDWAKPPTLVELKQELQDAKIVHDVWVSKVNVWLDNLRMTGTALPKITDVNKSKVAPKLIRKQAEWRYPSLSEPFLSTSDLFKINPVTWEDKKAAQQNQLLLNYQFNTQIDKVDFFDEYVRTAVDEGTVIVRVDWVFREVEEEVKVPRVAFAGNPAFGPIHEEIAALKQENPAAYETEVPLELQMAHDMSLEQGVPIEPTVIGHEMVKQMRTVENRPSLHICDYRNVVIDPTCRGKIENAKFIIYSFESSLSELQATGKYKNLESINLVTNNPLSEPDHASEIPHTFNFADKARQKFIVYEYTGYRDITGSGVLVPIVTAWVGDTLIRMEELPYPDKKLPFVRVQYLPVRRENHGEPDGALLDENQKIVGAVTRGMIDILGKTANGQTGTSKSFLDAVNRRKYLKGEHYEFNNVHPTEGIYTHKFEEIPQSAQLMLALQNQDAESLTGIKTYSDGVNSASLGEVAAGIRGALDAASKRELAILRRLVNGVVQIGRKIISMNAQLLSEKEVVRVTNEQFVEIRRDDLPGNFDLELTISTAEEDNAKAGELAFMLQTVGPNTDPGVTFMIMADIARLRKMPELAHKLENYQPQPDPMQQRIQQLEMLKLETEIKVMLGKVDESQAAAILDQAKALTEQAKARQLGSSADKQDLDFVEQESGVTQERDLQKQGEQARANMGLKVLDHNMKLHLEKYKKSVGGAKKA